MRPRTSAGDRRPDAVLLAALAAGLAFCLYGITSRYQNPDQMAFLPLFHPGKLPLNPAWFEKPPFHTYLNYFLSELPIGAVGGALGVPADAQRAAQTVWSKLLTACMFLGSVAIAFEISLRSFGRFAARVIAVLFATGAGFVAYSHFLTADIPVMFWMLAALRFSHRILSGRRTADYLLAGLLTGIATATKYNGLGVGVTLVAAHVLSLGPLSWRTLAAQWRELLFSPRLAGGLAMVAVGFVAGNPFAVLDFETFRSDFLYNYMVAPVYEGQSGSSYGRFFLRIAEVVGAPAFALLLAGVVGSLGIVARGGQPPLRRETVLLCLAAFLLYYAQFGPFPRLETRFVLPIVPLWLLMSGPLWERLAARRRPLLAALAAVVAYNMVCSALVGWRFLDDPRADAEAWARANVAGGSTIESDIYAPPWSRSTAAPVTEVWAPFVSGRERLFARVFPGNTFINGSEEDQARAEELVGWFTPAALERRGPDYVVANSLYYGRFVEPGIRAELYPSMRDFYAGLLAEEYRYVIVFDRESAAVPAWVYPRDIDFLHNRVTILARRDLAAPAGR